MGYVDAAEDGLALMEERDERAEERDAADERFGAVDGVEDPDEFRIGTVVTEFFADDAVAGIFCAMSWRSSSSAPRSAMVTGEASALVSTARVGFAKCGRMKSPLRSASSVRKERSGVGSTGGLNHGNTPKHTKKYEEPFFELRVGCDRTVWDKADNIEQPPAEMWFWISVCFVCSVVKCLLGPSSPGFLWISKEAARQACSSMGWRRCWVGAWWRRRRGCVRRRGGCGLAGAGGARAERGGVGGARAVCGRVGLLCGLRAGARAAGGALRGRGERTLERRVAVSAEFAGFRAAGRTGDRMGPVDRFGADLRAALSAAGVGKTPRCWSRPADCRARWTGSRRSFVRRSGGVTTRRCMMRWRERCCWRRSRGSRRWRAFP